MTYVPNPIFPLDLKPNGPFIRPAFIHQTGGLNGNWALDFMCKAATYVLAPQDCAVIKLSGHNPSIGVIEGDIFGWSTYLHVPDGMYFLTHQYRRFVNVGDWCNKGEIIGQVGGWPHDPGRTHLHCGFTSTRGRAASIERIRKVAAGPFRDGVWSLAV